jgi:hypothetical protein
LLGGSPYDTNHLWFPFNVFVHRFQASDGTDPHNHPWHWARALILWGSYREHRALYMPPSIWIHQTFNPGDWNRLDDEIFHHVTLQTPEVWTLFICGRKHDRGWGFFSFARGRFELACDYLRTLKGASSNERVIDR